MKLSKEFVRGLIRQQLSEVVEVPPPEDRLESEVISFEQRSEELEVIAQSLTDMGKYFQGVYPDFDSDLSDILGSVQNLMGNINDKIEELKNAKARS